jgi:uncharacterized protein YheU (UPF0270 family)
LIIDFGDGDWLSDPEDWELNKVSPLMVTPQLPTLSLIENGSPIGREIINPSRYLEFISPYRFDLAQQLTHELNRHDGVTNGLEQTVSGQGLVMAGIDNLYEIMRKGGEAVTSLTNRLMNLKGSVRQDGVVAYDLKRESVDIKPKNINKEPEVLRVIENRITALTGIPSFTIWGHTDGDGFGVKTSLELYDQRLTSLSHGYRKLIRVILEIFTPDDEELCRVSNQTIYPAKSGEVIDRLDKLVSALMGLQSIGSITALEVRDTVAADPEFPLILNPNPVILSGTPDTDPNLDNPNPVNSGFSG